MENKFKGKSLLLLLEKLQGDSYYVYSSDYNRITAKVEDEFNLFSRDKSKDNITKFSGMTVSDDKLNVSILSVVDGVVKLNPIQAKKVGLESTFESKVFRNQSIIKNGKRNMDKLTMLITSELKSELESEGYSIAVLSEEYEYKTNILCKVEIDISSLRVLDDVETILTTKEVLDTVLLRDKLIAERKVINYYLDELDKENPKEFMGGSFTPEQVELLKEHGINEKGEYVGVGDKKVVESEKFYIAKNFSFDIKGQASIPSVNAVFKKIEADKKLNNIESIIDELYEEYRNRSKDREVLEKELKNVNSELNSIKTLLFAVRLHKMMTEMGQFEDTDLDKKGNMTYSDGVNTLIIKVEDIKIPN